MTANEGIGNGAAPYPTITRHKYLPTNVGGIGVTEDRTVVGEQTREPLTLAGIAARRAKAGKLVAGTAAYSDSDMFKSPVCLRFFFDGIDGRFVCHCKRGRYV